MKFRTIIQKVNRRVVKNGKEYHYEQSRIIIPQEFSRKLNKGEIVDVKISKVNA